jgi:pentatricopeptide repeat protein
MIALADRALALNPGFARAWHTSGAIRLYAGELDLAIEHVENSMRLSPGARVGWAPFVIGTAHFLGTRFEEAVPKLLLAIQEDPTFLAAYRSLAACYAHMGRLDDAREVLERLRAIRPVVMPRDLPYRNPEHRELFLSGLRLAMGETT